MRLVGWYSMGNRRGEAVEELSLRAVCNCLCPLCRGDPCDRPWGTRAGRLLGFYPLACAALRANSTASAGVRATRTPGTSVQACRPITAFPSFSARATSDRVPYEPG